MTERLAGARDFILKNARLLERYLFAFHFEGGPAEPVVRALSAYQNPDGGFGNALEPDKRVPFSQPQDVEIAFEVLDAVGALNGDIAQRACDWLMTITTAEGGVPFTLPSANDFPHAPWWGTKEKSPPPEVNPTAAILGYLLKHKVAHPWVARASIYCWAAIEKTETKQFHDLMPIINFLQHAPERPRAEAALKRIADLIRTPGVVALDPAATGYVQKPLDWAPRADSFARGLFTDAVLQQHLEALAARQQDDGGWPISWDPLSDGVRLEWRGVVTIKALRTLQSYGA